MPKFPLSFTKLLRQGLRYVVRHFHPDSGQHLKYYHS